MNLYSNLPVFYTVIIHWVCIHFVLLPFFLSLCIRAFLHTVCTIAVSHVNIVKSKKPFYYGWFVYMWCIWLTSAVLSIHTKSVSFFTCFICNCNDTELQLSSDGDVWGFYETTVEFHNNSICGYTVLSLKRVYNLSIRKVHYVSWFAQLHHECTMSQRQATLKRLIKNATALFVVKCNILC